MDAYSGRFGHVSPCSLLDYFDLVNHSSQETSFILFLEGNNYEFWATVY